MRGDPRRLDELAQPKTDRACERARGDCATPLVGVWCGQMPTGASSPVKDKPKAAEPTSRTAARLRSARTACDRAERRLMDALCSPLHSPRVARLQLDDQSEPELP
ncbi:hypothetical protein DIPPA_62999, partial [Diplonema papillatum]